MDIFGAYTFRWAVCLLLLTVAQTTKAFVPSSSLSSSVAVEGQLSFSGRRSSCSRIYSTPQQSSSSSTQASSSPSTEEDDGEELIINKNIKKPSDQWELDCYSRPVVNGNKKLWEVLITDSNNSFRYRKALPSNAVNSKNLRQVVEDLIDKSDVKPTTIRFFRGAMFNMINIALSDLEIVSRPSRCTFSLAQWLEERHRDVYPKMEGYRSSMAGGGANAPGGLSFMDVRTPSKLPDALRGEKYAFVSLPLAEFRDGGGVNDETIGVGRLCPVDPNLPADAFVQGVVILTSRDKALASWLSGTEVCGLSADLRKRNLLMETDIDRQYLMAKLNDQQREEGVAFEQGKDQLNGLHFVCVQKGEDDDPAGFWLLRGIPTDI